MKVTTLALCCCLVTIGSAQELIVKLASQITVKQDGSNLVLEHNQLQTILNEHSPTESQLLFSNISSERNDPTGLLYNIVRLNFDSQSKLADAQSSFLNSPDVVYAEPNHSYSINQIDDPMFPDQWYLLNTSAVASWSYGLGNPDVIVGIIDTGIDYEHPDLRDQMWINSSEDLNQNGIRDEADFDGTDNDGNGYIDDVIGWDFTHAPDFPDQGDFLNPDNDPQDEFGSGGHGTPVAGLVAATQNNGIGISGIAPGVQLMALRAGTANGFLEEDDVAEAIVYAVENGCDIVNMSFGDVAFSFLLRDVIHYGVQNGVVFVAAAGNSASSEMNFPASLDETISVGATDIDNQLAPFSNYGAKLDIVAPGSNVLSTAREESYAPYDGTSFASPIVAGALALLKSKHPNYSPSQLASALYMGANDIGFDGWDTFYGHGLLDVNSSLELDSYVVSEIISPATGTGSSDELIAIIGSAYGPEMAAYTLAYGAGENPFEFNDILQSGTDQFIADTLFLWNTADLSDTSYTLKLTVSDLHGQTSEFRTVFQLDHSPPELSFLQTLPMIRGQLDGYLIQIQSDDAVKATLEFNRPGQIEVIHSEASTLFRSEHHFIIDEMIVSGEVEFSVRLENSAGSITLDDNNGARYALSLEPIAPTQSVLSLKETYPFSAFLMPSTADFDDDANPEIVISELGMDGEFGYMKILENESGLLQTRLETDFLLIPRDIGKSQLNGGLELLCGLGNIGLLLGGNTAGTFPQQVVWDDTTSFWSGRFENLSDEQGDEILALNFAKWKIYDINTQYELSELQTLQPAPGTEDHIFGVPWAVIDDFDGDGFREITVIDVTGIISVYEENSGGQYELIWTDDLGGNGSNSLLQSVDLDNDGLPELAAIVRVEPVIITESNIHARYWALRVYQSDMNNGFDEIASANFHGVTAQSGVYNGLAAGNIDSDPNEELIFTPFPEAYVLSLENGRMALDWYTDEINSNTAIVTDFDNSGQLNLILNSASGLQVWESEAGIDRPLPPAGLSATTINDSSIALTWAASEDTDYYNVYRRIGNESFGRIDSTTTSDFIDSTAVQDSVYTYAVTRIVSSFETAESNFSNEVSAVANPAPSVLSIDPLSNTQLYVRYSEPMAADAFTPATYLLWPNERPPQTVVRSAGAQDALLTFNPPLAAGSYRLIFNTPHDMNGTALPDSVVDMVFLIPESGEAFYLKTAELNSKTNIRLTFSHALQTESAKDENNYSLEPDGAILSAAIDASDSTAVDLVLSNDTRIGALGVPYYISVSNLSSASGQSLDLNRGNRLLLANSVESLENPVIYPNPYHAIDADQPLRFANLPEGARIYIYSSNGLFLKELAVDSPFGAVEWNLLSQSGEYVASGVYVYIIRYKDEEHMGKVLIVR